MPRKGKTGKRHRTSLSSRHIIYIYIYIYISSAIEFSPIQSCRDESSQVSYTKKTQTTFLIIGKDDVLNPPLPFLLGNNLYFED
jgi:hypothetical protein